MKSMLAVLALLLIAAAPDKETAPKETPPPYAPTSDYTQVQIEGWTVLVNNALLKDHAEVAARAQKLLAVKLFEIKHIMPAAAVGKMQKVRIWMEVRDRLHPCACYHPDAGWLKANGYNPDKAKSVDIANASTFLQWSKSQPSMILHELAHAYHDQVLGFNHAQVQAAYDQAVKDKKYESVLRWSGKMIRHYALNNAKEYFAEATEAYYGVNDYYPFVRAELQQHDQTIHDLLPKLWNLADE